MVQEFAQGKNGAIPIAGTVAAAERVIQTVAKLNGEVIVDDDGDLDIILCTDNFWLGMVNLLEDDSVYDDSEGIPVTTVMQMRRGALTAYELAGKLEGQFFLVQSNPACTGRE